MQSVISVFGRINYASFIASLDIGIYLREGGGRNNFKIRKSYPYSFLFSLYSNISSSARYSSLRQCMSATPSLIN